MTQTERAESPEVLAQPAPSDTLEAVEGPELLDSRVDEHKRLFLSRFHNAMLSLGLVATLVVRLGPWPLDLVALWSAHALMWCNLLILARGLAGVLGRQGAVAGLMAVQLLTPLLGTWLLVTLFPGAVGSVVIGASLWVIALFYASLERISA